MGGYSTVIKLEEMRRKLEEKDLLSALNILETMNTEKIKNISDLSLIAEVYSQNARYDEAKELLLKIYNKTKARKTLFQLIWVSIDSGNEIDSESFLSEYSKIAPEDFYNYIFRYKIDKMKGEPYEKLINTLKKLKKVEYIEKWAYELAKLYYKSGMEKECAEECADIILWFGEGTYVEKARVLKSYFSGDKDKNKIIEELKLRSKTTNEHKKIDENTETSIEDKKIDYQENNKEENIITDYNNSEAVDQIKENEDNKYDFTPKDDIDQLSAALKQDIQSIMNEEYEKQLDLPIYEATSSLEELSHELELNLEQIFTDILHNEEDKQKLSEILLILLKEDFNNLQFVISGEIGYDKTSLAKGIAMVLKKAGKIKSSKIARINAEKLNAINLLDKKDVLLDCCMIIENANIMNKSALDQIQELIVILNGDIAVIYEEEDENKLGLFIGQPER